MSHKVRVAEPALGAVLLGRVGRSGGHGLCFGPPVRVVERRSSGGSRRGRSTRRRSIVCGRGIIFAACSCSLRAPGAAGDASRGPTTSEQRAPRRCRHEHASAFFKKPLPYLTNESGFDSFFRFAIEGRGGSEKRIAASLSLSSCAFSPLSNSPKMASISRCGGPGGCTERAIMKRPKTGEQVRKRKGRLVISG